MSTKIEWTEETWNPLVGCDKVSDGCKNCYAIGMAYRLAHIGSTKALYGPVVKKTAGGALNWTGVVAFNTEALYKPLNKKKPTMYFVNSMSDLFHDAVPFEFIDRVFDHMDAARQHIFQILTKRAERMVEFFKWKAEGNGFKFGNDWPLKNVWIGVSVEDQKSADARIPLLMQVPAAVRWLSMEPLLGGVNLTSLRIISGEVYRDVLNGTQQTGPGDDFIKLEGLRKLDWVVVGGESGRGSRPMHPDWVKSLRDQCVDAGVPFFFKQWGDFIESGERSMESDKVWNVYVNTDGSTGSCCFLSDGQTVVNYTGGISDKAAIVKRVGKKVAGRLLDGKEWNELPDVSGVNKFRLKS